MGALEKRLLLLRKQRGLTQLEMGNLLNMSKQKVGHLETGTRKPTREDIVAFEEEFNLSSQFFEEIEIDTGISIYLEQMLNHFLNKDIQKLEELPSFLSRKPIYHVRQEFQAKLLWAIHSYRTRVYDVALDLEATFLNVYLESHAFKDYSQFERQLYHLYHIEKFNYLGEYRFGEKSCSELKVLLRDERHLIVSELKEIFFQINQDEFAEAFENLLLLKDKIEQLNDENLLSDFLFYQALCLSHLKLYVKAFNILTELEVMSQRSGDIKRLAIVYQNKGMLYNRRGVYELGLFFQQKAYDLLSESPQKGRLIRTLIYTAIALKRIELAKFYIKEAEKYILEEDDRISILGYKSEIALYEGDLSTHESYLDRALVYFQQNNDIKSLRYIYRYLARYYAEQRKYKQSSEYFMKMEELAYEKN